MASVEEEAEAQFITYDFAADEEFVEYRSRFDSTVASSGDVETTLRRRYFRQRIDANLPREPPASKGSSPTSRRHDATGASSSSPQASSLRPATSASSSGPSVFEKIVEKAQLRMVLNVGTFLLGIVAIILPDSGKRVSRALFVAMLSFTMSLLRVVGRPRLNKEYLSKVLACDDLHYLMYCTIFFESPNVQVCLMPIIIFSAVNSVRELHRWLSGNSPSILERFELGNRLQTVLRSGPALVLTVAKYEIFLSIYLIVTGFSRGARGLFMLFGYSNFLQVRYQASAYSRAAWGQLDGAIQGLLVKYLPAATPYYDRIRSSVKRFSSNGITSPEN
ncbi:hypothetical protein NDN08_002752 [Rhodosorus marinus]|uniref:Transmembrane protein 33 n=1 Tax=Rhodosorus marinus TaxID=101924 RepID=A0AAV8UUS2_9RHOD|nr:hypothetical protein NDN08_002752 [Rhodosorus marinus]